MGIVDTRPKHECPMGYSVAELQALLPDYDDFTKWVSDQGWTSCPFHGKVYHFWDVDRYRGVMLVVD